MTRTPWPEDGLEWAWVTGQGPRPTFRNRVEFLIDNEAAWGRLEVEIAEASDSVRAMLFMLDIPHVRVSFRDPVIGRAGAPGSVRLEERLLSAAERGVDVALLINHVVPAVSPANTTRAIEVFFRRNDPGRRVRIARLKTPQAMPIHAKVFVIDGRVAYLMGSGFAQEYFDSRRHRIDEPRRGSVRWRSSIRAPVHDVSVRIEGPAVADLDATFDLHGRSARLGDRLPPLTIPQGTSARPPSTGSADRASEAPDEVPLQVTRTLPGARFAELPDGETGVFESYVRALQRARRFVYLENQYFTCVEVVDTLVEAMLRQPSLELIALINIKPDIPGYVGWQVEAIERLFDGLGDQADRAGLFTLWSHEGATGSSGRTRLLRTYVHSKLAIVDDAWLTLGSANLDGNSLLAGEHAQRWPLGYWAGRPLGVFGGGDQRTARSSEVNVSCAALPGHQPPADIDRLRRELWAEHLGFGVTSEGAEHPTLSSRTAGSWLELWREHADRKLAGLRAADPLVTEPRILPIPIVGGHVSAGIDRPEAYLRALGVDPARIDVLRRTRSFSFGDGRWR